jgi:thiamine pyrophosphokinase
MPVKNRALLIAAGELSSSIFQGLISNEKMNIAIDGGYNHCIKFNIIPEILIGDFDSINTTIINENVTIIHQESQEETDLLKGINWAIKSGIIDLDIIGIESGRSDHILGTYAALAELDQTQMQIIDIQIHLNDFIVKYIPINRVMKFNFNKGTHLSLFCLSKSNVTFTGVKWNLNKEKINFSTRGIHNYSTKKETELILHDGGPALLFIHR